MRGASLLIGAHLSSALPVRYFSSDLPVATSYLFIFFVYCNQKHHGKLFIRFLSPLITPYFLFFIGVSCHDVGNHCAFSFLLSTNGSELEIGSRPKLLLSSRLTLCLEIWSSHHVDSIPFSRLRRIAILTCFRQ